MGVVFLWFREWSEKMLERVRSMPLFFSLILHPSSHLKVWNIRVIICDALRRWFSPKRWNDRYGHVARWCGPQQSDQEKAKTRQARDGCTCFCSRMTKCLVTKLINAISLKSSFRRNSSACVGVVVVDYEWKIIACVTEKLRMKQIKINKWSWITVCIEPASFAWLAATLPRGHGSFFFFISG